MKLYKILSACFFVTTLLFLSTTLWLSKDKWKPLDSYERQLSYALGDQIGHKVKEQKISVDPQILTQAIHDVLNGSSRRLSQVEMSGVLRQHMKQKREAIVEKFKPQKEMNAKWLAGNKTKPGIVETKSGLQYRVLREGKGDSPKLRDAVDVKYVGKFLDGKEFDSSAKSGGKTLFDVGDVIPAWTEALQMMKAGSKLEIFAPYSLAYGDLGIPKKGIAPYATLVFEIELLKIYPGKGKLAQVEFDAKNQKLGQPNPTSSSGSK